MVIPKGYKQTDVGVIPEEWENKSWGDVAGGFSSGATPYRAIKEYYYGNIKWVSSGELNYNIIYDTIEHISNEARKKTCLALHSPGTFLMAITGLEAAGTRGSCAILGCEATTNQSCMAIYGTKCLSEQYLFYYYTNYGDTLAFKYCQGTKQQSYTAKIVRSLPIILPPIGEQKRIAEALSDTDELIFSLEKLIAKKKAIKQGAMQQLLTGKMRLPGFNGEWRELEVSSLGKFVSGNCFPLNYQGAVSGKYPFYKVSDFSNEGNTRYLSKANNYISMDVSSHLNCSIIPAHAIVFAKIGAAIFLERKKLSVYECCIDNNMMAFCPNNDVDYIYAWCLLQTISFGKLVEATALPSLSGRQIGCINIKLPPINEQKAIATVLLNMDSEVDALEQKLNKYRQIKQGMMQQLLTGKIRLVDSVPAEKPEPKIVDMPQPQNRKPKHDPQIDDAVVIAAIVDTFYSDKYPLGRVKVQKLLYLLRRHQEASVEEFKKKAAGPYADTVRYKGGEQIAVRNKYVVLQMSDKGTRFYKGEKINQALEYIKKWNMSSDIQWLKDNFLHSSRDDLELYATVDMAMNDLTDAGIPVSVDAIKGLIKSNKDWKDKLAKPFFNDENIRRAIVTRKKILA